MRFCVIQLTTYYRRHCSSDSDDKKGADKLASLLTSLKKKQPSDKMGTDSEGVKLAQPRAKKPIKRTKGGLPKPKYVEMVIEHCAILGLSLSVLLYRGFKTELLQEQLT